MKKILDFIEENCFPIFLTIGFAAIAGCVIICEIQMACLDLYELEEKCFNFYKENNYILEECNKYANKLKGE